MKHTWKMWVRSGAVALCAMFAGCAASPMDETAAETAAPRSGVVCDSFCQSQGGPNYLMTFATSEAACTQKSGDWYTDQQSYPGPPPGCCCKCTRPGFCL